VSESGEVVGGRGGGEVGEGEVCVCRGGEVGEGVGDGCGGRWVGGTGGFGWILDVVDTFSRALL